MTTNDFKNTIHKKNFKYPTHTNNDFNVTLMILSNNNNINTQSFNINNYQNTNDIQETPNNLINFTIDLEHKYN